MRQTELHYYIYDIIKEARAAGEFPSAKQIIEQVKTEKYPGVGFDVSRRVERTLADLVNKDYIAIQDRSKKDIIFTLGSRSPYPMSQQITYGRDLITVPVRRTLSDVKGTYWENENIYPETLEYGEDFLPSVKGKPMSWVEEN